MKKIIGKLLKFLGKKPNYQSEEFQNRLLFLEEKLDFLNKSVILNEQDNTTLLALASIYTKKNDNMNKSISALAKFIDNHTKDIKELNKLADQHAKVINDNMSIFKNYLEAEGIIDQYIAPTKSDSNQSVDDVLKMMDQSTKKDFGKN